MEKNRIIIIALLVVIIALLVGMIAMMPNFSKENSKITIKSNDTIAEGDSIQVKLTDANNTPIANETINVTISDNGGEVDHKSVKTNKKGVAKVKIDEDEGTYTLNCSFDGNDNFTKNATVQKIEVKKAVKQAEVTGSSPTDDPGAFYSAQSGRVIYTGEVHDAPDGHKWRHLGYNEWERID
ncbi:hypothetical protein [Methanobrevibacter sp.]